MTKFEYPDARREDVTHEVGGVSFPDPYTWLEEQSEDALAWEKAQDAIAADYVRDGGFFDRWQPRVAEVYADTFGFHAPRRVGGRWWRQSLAGEPRLPVIEVADTPTGAGRVVVDVAALPGTSASSTLDYWAPSPDGQLLIYVVSQGGHGAVVRIVEVDSGTLRKEWTPDVTTAFFEWTPDSQGFYCAALGATVGEDGSLKAVSEIRYGSAAPGAPEPVAEPIVAPHPAVFPKVSGGHVLYLCSQTDPRPAYIKSLEPGAEWRPFLLDREGLCKGAIVGDAYIGITTDTSPTGRVVAVPLATPTDESTWTELVAPSDAKLASVTAVGDRFVLASFTGGIARLQVLSADGAVVHEVALPGEGAVGKSGVGHIMAIMDDVVWADGDQVSFVFSALDRSPASFSLDVQTGELTELTPPATDLSGTTKQVVRQLVVDDGATITYRIFAPVDADLSSPRPTIVTGYGGFNVPWLPCYDVEAAAWVANGGVWVHCHLRGGGEFGEEFWRQGRMANKPRTFDDLNAVAEQLVADGVATPDMLGVWGSSNGGLLAAAVVTRRPDLWRASVPQVPFLDNMRAGRDPMPGMIAAADYGVPEDPSLAPVLLSYAPVHNVTEGRAYPAVFLDAGANDATCPSWHARKMAAALQHASTSGHPVILRVRHESGHNSMSAAQWIERDAEELAFFARELGLDA